MNGTRPPPPPSTHAVVLGAALLAGGCIEPFPAPEGVSNTGLVDGSTGPTSETTTDGPSTETTADTGAETGGGTIPSGGECTSGDECLSGRCWSSPLLGGVCGECTSDDHCPAGGCTQPDYFSDPVLGAKCNMGELGGGCESDEVCQGSLTCEVIVDVSGIYVIRTCSECSSDADCQPGRLCSPSFALSTGAKLCVSPGSQPLGSTCDPATSGNEACASGICAATSVQGLSEIGICSECRTDPDCGAGEACEEARLDLEQGPIAGECIPAAHPSANTAARPPSATSAPTPFRPPPERWMLDDRHPRG
jgi:hypothetical protein